MGAFGFSLSLAPYCGCRDRAAGRLVVTPRNRVTLPRVATALVLGLVVRALLCFPGLIAHLHRVIGSDPLEAVPVSRPVVVVIHVPAVIEPLVLLRLAA